MTKKKLAASGGFTLIELIIATVITVFVVSAIGAVIVDSQNGWNTMYKRIYADVVTDGYVARRKFDTVMRKASAERFLLDGAGSWLEIYYYADDDSALVDRYALFYVADGNLNVEYGQLNPKKTMSVETICSNVSSCVFKQAGRSAQMILMLDDGKQKNTIVSSAVSHN